MENPAVNAGSVSSAILTDPAKWRTLLNEFEKILKINLFIVDQDGRVLVAANFSENREVGGALFAGDLIKTTFGISFDARGEGFWGHFEPWQERQVATDPFDLSLFAVPVSGAGADGKILFYLIAGPVRLGKAWPDEKYAALATSLGFGGGQFLENIKSVPEISEAGLNAVLELLSEVAKDVFELSAEKQKISQLQNRGDATVRPEIFNAVQELLSDIQNDELLITILDAAIKMAGAEGGSIMIFDEEKQEFVIKVSRGLTNKENVIQHRFKAGEGIAGIAALEKTSFFINGMEGDSRIQHLLKRPDIKQSFVVPILSSEKVIGVLNLSIKSLDDVSALAEVKQDIQRFSPLIAAALRSL